MRSPVLSSRFRPFSPTLTVVALIVAVTTGACSLLVPFDKGGGGTAGTAGSGAGIPGDCSIDADCLPPGQEANACFVAKCIGAECTITEKPDGTELQASAQVEGDCQKKLCMARNIVDQPDPEDTGGDGNPCTVEACNGIMPTTMSAPAGTSCGGAGLVCDGKGTCKGCKMDSDCPTGTSCSGFVCDIDNEECDDAPVMAGTVVPMAEQMPGDCKSLVCDGDGKTMEINDDTDAPVPADECTTSMCSNGAPMDTPAAAGTKCMTTRACDGAGVCLGAACMAPADCPGDGPCVDGVCCDTACGGLCQACTAALKGAGLDGQCGPVMAGTDPGMECTDPQTCNGMGACKAPTGAACAAAGDCATGFCVDMVCCDMACGGLCQACSAAKKGQGANGACGPIKAGNDPDMECTSPMTCNGAGVCN
jgi:hypothetical protein